MIAYETLLVADHGSARVVTINRPKALNALDGRVIAELSRVLEDLQEQIDAGDWSIRGLVLIGAGDKAFVAGADISAMVDMSPDQAMQFASSGHAIGEMLANLPVPTIAAVSGFALGGGCELALACDFIIASDKARFGQPEVKLGVIPGFGGTQRLLRRVGTARALELCVTGAMIDAHEALRIGLVNKIVELDKLLEASVGLIEIIALQGPLAVAAAKRVIHRGAELPLAAANQLEVEAFAELFASADQKEGMQAFLAKRAANFSGK